jgi:hypothetical protein
MPRIDVILPWKPGCVYRDLNRGWVIDQWERLGITPLTGWCLDDWSKAAAVDDALRRSTADAVIISDADVWPQDWDDTHGQQNAVYATQTLLNDHPWVMPFDTVLRLDPAATSTVLTGDPPNPNATLTQRPYRGLLGGGFLAIRRDVYDDCPLDARFIGWGQEDEAWGAALTALHPAGRRLPGNLFHLWHPPQPRANRAVGSKESKDLRDRYYRARRNPVELRRLIDDGRVV